jgi:NTE family protein
MKNRKTVGLALGSGGVRGLAHIGVIKTLLKHKIPIDYISGASIGAWVGAHFALYQDIEKTADFTAGKKKEKLISFLEPNISGGLVKGDKLELLVNEWLDNANFEDLKIPLKIAVTDLLSGNKIVCSEGKLAPAVRASISVPGVFKPVIFEHRALVDGGLSNPVPVDLVKELGAEIVVAVNLDFFSGFDNISPTDVGYGNVADGTIKIMRHHLARYSCRGADFVIEPDLMNFSSWSNYFMNDNVGEGIKLAEEATEKIIPALKEMIFE